VFDPADVVPEFTADVGVKRGEKVDYAIMKDGTRALSVRNIACSNSPSGSAVNIVHQIAAKIP
jgi:hypothetical protein